MSNLAEKHGLAQRVFHRSTASTNAVVLVDGPAILVGFNMNEGATQRWLKFYDKNTEPLPTDEPIYVTKGNASLPVNSTTLEIFCENGIAIRITANGSPTTAFWDDTAIGAEEVFLNVFYRRVAPKK